jgi:hypothetical protein
VSRYDDDIIGLINRCDWISPPNEKLPGLCDHVRGLLSVAESQTYMLWDRERAALISCAEELIGMMERGLEEDAVAEAEAYAREAAS